MISSEKAKQSLIKTNNGTMRTQVVFYDSSVDSSLDGRDGPGDEIFKCYAELYNPSSKDVEIMKVKSVKEAVTIRIRDPLTGYVPKNNHQVEIKDSRYAGKYWQIVDIRPDFEDRRWLTILLGGDNL